MGAQDSKRRKERKRKRKREKPKMKRPWKREKPERNSSLLLENQLPATMLDAESLARQLQGKNLVDTVMVCRLSERCGKRAKLRRTIGLGHESAPQEQRLRL